MTLSLRTRILLITVIPIVILVFATLAIVNRSIGIDQLSTDIAFPVFDCTIVRVAGWLFTRSI